MPRWSSFCKNQSLVSSAGTFWSLENINGFVFCCSWRLSIIKIRFPHHLHPSHHVAKSQVIEDNQGGLMFSLSKYSLLEYMRGYPAKIKKENQSHSSTTNNLLFPDRWVGKEEMTVQREESCRSKWQEFAEMELRLSLLNSNYLGKGRTWVY